MDSFKEVAVEACETAGSYLADRFDDGDRRIEHTRHDARIDADRCAEQRMSDIIRGTFPDHEIRGEKTSERDADSPYRWLLDPLDGTHNFAVGVPVFATAAALLEDGDPVLSVVHEPLTDRTYVAERWHGAQLDGETITADSDTPLDRATVTFSTGNGVKRDSDRSAAASIERQLSDRCKRVLKTWAPCVDWGLVARGNVEALVAFHPDGAEHHAGTLLARESDAVFFEDDELTVVATNDDALATLRDALA